MGIVPVLAFAKLSQTAPSHKTALLVEPFRSPHMANLLSPPQKFRSRLGRRSPIVHRDQANAADVVFGEGTSNMNMKVPYIYNIYNIYIYNIYNIILYIYIYYIYIRPELRGYLLLLNHTIPKAKRQLFQKEFTGTSLQRYARTCPLGPQSKRCKKLAPPTLDPLSPALAGAGMGATAFPACTYTASTT